MKQSKIDNLTYRIYDSRAEMGAAAAEDAYKILKKLLETKDEVNVIFAAAPSQNEVLASLASKDLEWNRINAFHMDEYVGLDKDAPQGFYNFLNAAIFSKLPFKSVHRINGNQDTAKTIAEYTDLLKKYPCDLCCMGIGENGHIAFNDPGVADFNDKAMIKVAKLDEVCRNQQVNDGCFKTINDVPTHALTLTIPTLFAATYVVCVVPAATKANAVKRTVTGEISDTCPATILRKHTNAVLYLDPDSAKLI